MPRRRRLEVDERRAQLLALGRELFSRRGYDEVAIDEVAQQAGISKGLLYHYFRSKREFYVATLRHVADELTSYITPDPSLGPVAQVAQGVDHYLHYVEVNRTGYTSLMRGGIEADTEIHAILERARDEMVQLVLHRMAPYGTPTAARRIAVRGWVGFAEATSLEWLEQAAGGVSRKELRRLCVHILLQSLSASAPEASPGM